MCWGDNQEDGYIEIRTFFCRAPQIRPSLQLHGTAEHEQGSQHTVRTAGED